MASHHHCQNHHPTCYCCCSSSSYQSSHTHLPSHLQSSCQSSHTHLPSHLQSSPIDPPLVQAIATQLLQSHHFTHYLQPQTPQQLHHQNPQQQETQALFTSLLRRIDALESSLQHISASPSPALSLRHLAARTIQTHFRAYLVRRSRTLGRLKHLAFIKSSLNSLKSSLSDKTHHNYEAISQKAMDLLIKLDFIQGGDPMIRDGKKSISRELVRFLEFIDGVSAKRQQLYSKAMKKVRFEGEMEEPRVYTHEPFSCDNVMDLDDQRVSSDNQEQLLEKLSKKIEDFEGFSRVYEDEAHMENEGYLQLNNPRKNVNTKVNNGHFLGQNGNFLFSAPLPVYMEPRKERRL